MKTRVRARLGRIKIRICHRSSFCGTSFLGFSRVSCHTFLLTDSFDGPLQSSQPQRKRNQVVQIAAEHEVAVFGQSHCSMTRLRVSGVGRVAEALEIALQQNAHLGQSSLRGLDLFCTAIIRSGWARMTSSSPATVDGGTEGSEKRRQLPSGPRDRSRGGCGCRP